MNLNSNMDLEWDNLLDDPAWATRAGLSEGRPPLKPTTFLPSKFSGEPGEDPVEHFNSYQDYVDIQGIESEADALFKFRFTLNGKAATWFRNKVFLDLADLQTKFVRYFSGVYCRENEAALFKCIKFNPIETMEEFYGRVKNLGDRLNYPDNVIMDTFLGELPTDIQYTLGNIARIDRSLDLVEEADRLYQRHRQKATEAPVTPNPGLLAGDSSQQSVISAEMGNTSTVEVPECEAYTDHGTDCERSRPHFRAPKMKRDEYLRYRRQFGQGYPTHMRRPQPIQCHRCQGYGHKWRVCTSPPFESYQSNHIESNQDFQYGQSYLILMVPLAPLKTSTLVLLQLPILPINPKKR